MLRPLMIVSGCVEIVFGIAALIVPTMLIEAVGGETADVPTLALMRLLGSATFGLGVAALLARNHLDTAGGLAAAYGLGLYNVLAAAALLFAVMVAGGAGLWRATSHRDRRALLLRACDAALALAHGHALRRPHADRLRGTG
jgi:hypothetical protein